MAVLVNNFSASASEIVSACLQDNSRAKIIGERTWGKGSVQNVIELEEGRSILKLTTASYLRPNGKNIHRFADAKESDDWGVRPDEGFEIKMTPLERGQYMRYRRERDVQRPGADEEQKPEEPKEPKAEDESEKPKEEAPKADEEASKADEDAPKSDDESSKEDAPEASKSPSDKPSTPPAPADADDAPKPRRGAFVDRQLKKAVEYVVSQLAPVSEKKSEDVARAPTGG
jgi:carboxyl-terminal processing protease